MKLRWKLGLITVISLLITTFITASFTQWVVSDAMEIRQENSLKMGAISIQQTNDLNLYDDMEITATVIQDGKVTAGSATVGTDGKVTSVATITATAADGKTATCTVYVVPNGTEATMSKEGTDGNPKRI